MDIKLCMKMQEYKKILNKSIKIYAQSLGTHIWFVMISVSIQLLYYFIGINMIYKI